MDAVVAVDVDIWHTPPEGEEDQRNGIAQQRSLIPGPRLRSRQHRGHTSKAHQRDQLEALTPRSVHRYTAHLDSPTHCVSQLRGC